jgi:orotate phosphoribosyltransferase-like protein
MALKMPNEDSQEPKPPESMATSTPKDVRSYDEMNTHTMVFELQGTVGELKEAVTTLGKTLDKTSSRLETEERSISEIKDQLTKLNPKIDDIVGFIKHGVPNLATKADLGDLKLEIEKRPTRRQAILDITLVVGLIAAVLTISTRVAH